MVPAPLSTRFQSFTPLPTIKLGPSGAGSQVGGPVHPPGPCGSLQRPLPRGWESPPLPPQSPRASPIRGLRLHFPMPEPWAGSPPLIRFICARMWGHGACQWPDCLPCLSHTPPVSVPPQQQESSLPRLPVSTPPTSLDERLSFISLVSDFLAV